MSIETSSGTEKSSGTETSSRSPWQYVGIGCGAALLLVLIGGGIVAYQGFKAVGSQIIDMQDPVKRTQKVKSILGSDTLPPGYFATMAIDVETPLKMKMVILSDVDPATSEQNSQSAPKEQLRGLTWLEVEDDKGDAQELNDFVEGKAEGLTALKRWNVDVGSSQPVGRGVYEQNGGTVRYMTYLGEVKVQNEEMEGVNTVFSVTCPGANSALIRFGVWFSRDFAERAAVVANPKAPNTLADEATLQQLTQHIRVCPATPAESAQPPTATPK